MAYNVSLFMCDKLVAEGVFYKNCIFTTIVYALKCMCIPSYLLIGLAFASVSYMPIEARLTNVGIHAKECCFELYLQLTLHPPLSPSPSLPPSLPLSLPSSLPPSLPPFLCTRSLQVELLIHKIQIISFYIFPSSQVSRFFSFLCFVSCTHNVL